MSKAASIWRRPSGLACFGFFSLLPAAATSGGLAVPALLGLAGLASIRPSIGVPGLLRPHPAAAAALAFVVWAALSSLWSPGSGHERALKLVLITAAGTMFALAASADAAARRLTLAVGAAAAVILTVMLAIEAGLDLPMTRLYAPGLPDWETALAPGRGASVLAGVLWAGAGALLMQPSRWRWPAAAALIAIGAAAGGQFQHTANAVAFVLGLAAFAAGYAAPRFTLLAVTGGLALWLALAPVIYTLPFEHQSLQDQLPFSWAARMEAWKFLSGAIGEAPWFGHGFNAAHANDDTIILRGAETQLVPSHPHSASLQIWFETGVVGAALAATALMLGGRAMARACARHRPAAAALAATFTALGFIANVSYSLWQEWWVAAMFVAAALCAALARSRPGAE